MIRLIIIIIFASTICFSKEEVSDFERFLSIYNKYDSTLTVNNYYKIELESVFINLGNLKIDSSKSILIFKSNELDTIVGYSYYFEAGQDIYYNHNYINYYFDKDNRNFFESKNISFLNDIGHLYTSFKTFLIPYTDKSMFSGYKESEYYDVKIEDEDDTEVKFYLQNKNIDNDMLLNYRFVFNKMTNLLKSSEVINTFFGTSYFSKSEIKNFEFINEKEFIKVDTLISNYAEKFRFVYDNYVCNNFPSDIKGKRVFDKNLDNIKGSKIVAFINHKNNKNIGYIKNDLTELAKTNKMANIIYEFKDSTLYKTENKVTSETDKNTLLQYNVQKSPCIFILNEENELLDHIEGYGIETKQKIKDIIFNIKKN